MNKFKENVNFILLTIILITIDYIIKSKIFTNFSEGQSIDIIKNFFSITFVKNKGAAFGILQNRKIVFILIASVAIFILIKMFLKTTYIISKISISMIISGAIGNIIDRIKYGFVIDMFDFHGIWVYVFNFADICVVLGVFILCISILKND